MREDKDLRTLKSKTFILDTHGTRRRLVTGINNIHYHGKDGLEDIDMNIEDGKITKCDYNIELLEGKVGYKGIDPNGKEIELELLDVAYREPEIKNNVVTYEEVAKDTDLKLVFLPGKIKVLRILKSNEAPLIGRFRSKRQRGAAGKLYHKGIDSNKRRTKLTVSEENVNNAEKIITQTFDNKVMHINPKTRKRSWSTEIAYPVIIDPTSTFYITNGNSVYDGWAEGGAYTTDPGNYSIQTYMQPYDSYAFIYRSTYYNEDEEVYINYMKVGWMMFYVNGIANGTLINSATLNMYGGNTDESTAYIYIAANTSSNISYPTNVNQVLGSPSGMLSYGTSAEFTEDQYISDSEESTQYTLSSTNVTSLVSSLVTSNDYSSGANMLFYQRPQGNFYPEVLLYQMNFGSFRAATLVIDYSAGWTHTINSVISEDMHSVETVLNENIRYINTR